MTHIYKEINSLKSSLKNTTGTVGFVPSLGTLHAGHISLIEKSIADNDFTVVSLFLNPKQFNNENDLKNYPNTMDEDISILKRLGVNFVLTPEVNKIYPDDYTFQVIETKVSNVLCGATRPGHFEGVLTIVLKLLNIIRPDKAYFGAKDYQQYLLIKKMSEAFFLGTEVIACPTVRESSGLALSSRNLMLTEENKLKAPNLHKVISGASTIEEMNKELTALGFKVDYLEEHWGRRFVAAFLGEVRLIDNVQI